MTKRVVGYIRVSSQEQVDDGESLERQTEQIQAYCKLKGYNNPQIIADQGESGFKTARKGFQRLVTACKRQEADIVVVYDLSRLSRSVRDTLEFVEDVIQKNGIEFVSLMQDIDTATALGKAFLTFNALFCQLYRDEISEKTSTALTHKIRKKEKTGGLVPFGYELSNNGKLMLKDDEYRIVQLISNMRKGGATFQGIVNYLHQQGIKTKTGKDTWYPNTVKQILNRRIEQVNNASDQASL